MFIVRATCPNCGAVEIVSIDVQVFVDCEKDNGLIVFECPECDEVVSQPVDAVAIAKLRVLGMPKHDMPKFDNGTGPPISLDDVHDFHNEINEFSA